MKKVMSDQALADLRQRLDRAYVTRDRDELNKILVITEWLSQLTPSPLIRLIAASAESAVAMNSATNPLPGSDVAATRWLAVGSLMGLLLLCVAWELWLAPLRPGGTWLFL